MARDQQPRPDVPTGESLPDVPDAALMRRAPWSVLVLVAVWFIGVVWLALVAEVLRATGRFPGAETAGSTAALRLGMWASCFALPLQLVSAIFLVRATSKATLADMGLTWHRLTLNLFLGLAALLVLAPLAYGVQFALERLLRLLSPSVVQDHPFNLLAREGLSPVEWGVMVLAAVVAAPLWEELFFRGLIQPWVIERPSAGAVLMGLAAALGVAFRSEHLQEAAQAGLRNVLVELIPALTALALVPVYLLLRHRCRSPVPAGIFATSVLFGWFHVRFWPSPVALTLLALGLGLLAWRSRSLAGPMILHAAFNGLACVVLIIEHSG
jgi:membrane protease YdiL (CAAX protease family)